MLPTNRANTVADERARATQEPPPTPWRASAATLPTNAHRYAGARAHPCYARAHPCYPRIFTDALAQECTPAPMRNGAQVHEYTRLRTSTDTLLAKGLGPLECDIRLRKQVRLARVLFPWAAFVTTSASREVLTTPQQEHIANTAT